MCAEVARDGETDEPSVLDGSVGEDLFRGRIPRAQGSEMPILAEQQSVYPEELIDLEPGEPGDRRWWVLYTKARQEKALARDLLGLRVPFYLPLVSKQSLLRGRVVRSQIPLFPGYVFLHATPADRIRSLVTNRVSRILSVEDEASLWRDLRQIRRLIASGAPLTIESRLIPGSRVRVRHGTLAGLEGVVLRRRCGSRLLVAVRFLQQGASVEVDECTLEPID